MPFVLYWEADTIVVFGSVMAIGYTVATGLTLLLFVAAAIGAVKLHVAMKNAKSKGYYFHLAYRLGLRKTTQCIPSDERVFIGS